MQLTSIIHISNSMSNWRRNPIQSGMSILEGGSWSG